jgi:NADPH:quinone reductase-like Zn-dependent oxidoreductase
MSAAPRMWAAVAERPDGLVVRAVPRPRPRRGWALVKVEAFGVNRAEYATLRGWSGAAVTFPRILGIECVGTVAAVAAGAAVEPGAPVAAALGGMGRTFDGGYAEYALLPERRLMPLDSVLPWEVLAALPETFLSACGLLDPLRLRRGQTLLVRGAASSLGIACLELARAAGVRVLATARREAERRALAAHGAAAVVLEGRAFAERPDGVVDLIGGRAVRASYHADPSAGGSRLRAVVEQVERGVVDPGIDRVYTLDEILEAHRRLAAGRAAGKIVVAL